MSEIYFECLGTDNSTSARIGRLTTAHGVIETPIFMPVGTIGSVKGVHQRELSEDIKAQIILGNTYHLYLRPGMEVMEQAGGLHKFIQWDKPILTDSGGYQVFSLAARRKISEEGVRFQSHIDGSYHTFTPESAIDIQRSIGADIIMAFDECTPYPCTHEYAEKSMHLTHRWLDRCMTHFRKNSAKYDHPQALFPIIQGSVYDDLRTASTRYITQHEAVGYAIGGLSVGEPKEDLYRITQLVCEQLPNSRARYLMGVGTPANLLECIARGMDMFDCVMPTRNGRNGMLFTRNGIVHIKNKKWETDFSPLDPDGTSYVDTAYTKAYLRHLFKAKELLGMQIASIHNLAFYLSLMQEAREHISNHTFGRWKNEMMPRLTAVL